MDAILKLLFEASIRSIVIAIAVGCVLRVMRVKSPAVAHRAWVGVLLIMLILPVVSLWAPRMPIPLLSAPSTRQETGKMPAATSYSFPMRGLASWGRDQETQSFSSELPQTDSTTKPPVFMPEILPAVLIVYVIGCCFFLFRLLTGMFLSYKLMRNAQCHDRGFYLSQCTVPLTVGFFRTRILLPLDSNGWSFEKLHAVLSHEEEHQRRRDPLIAWLALLNRCIYWFHPLAWCLCSRLAALAEQACDEEVLSKGHTSSAYAGYLLEFAGLIKQKGVLVEFPGSPFHGSKLALRIRRILSAGRTPVISPVRLMAITALCAVAILAPAIGELTRAHAAPPILNRKPLTVSSDGNESLSSIQSRVEAVLSNQSAEPTVQQRTVPDSIVTTADEALLEKGSEYLKKGEYTKARLAYQTFIKAHIMEIMLENLASIGHFTRTDPSHDERKTQSPLQDMVLEAEFAIADSYYDEGGVQNLLKAMSAYDFILRIFPANPKAEEAWTKALKTMNRFLEYPYNDNAPIVHRFKVMVEEHLALANFETAQFYAEKGNHAAAIIRLKRIIDYNHKFSRMDDVKRLYEALTVNPDQFMAPAKPAPHKDGKGSAVGGIPGGVPDKDTVPSSPVVTFEKGNTPTIEALLAQKKALLEQYQSKFTSRHPNVIRLQHEVAYLEKEAAAQKK
jgi:beta-lactamase regulating signal transducer with metallopeptidase domain